MDLDTTLWLAGFVMLAAVILQLIYRRVWRTLPIFCAYTVWTLAGSAVAYYIFHDHPSLYLITYAIESYADFVLQLCVLVELTWSILRPFRASLPKATIWVLIALIIGATLAIWPFSDSSAFANRPMQWHLLVRAQQTASILRVLFFLLLAGCSQLLSIGWRDRELQVATGLGFYSLAALTTTVLHSHQAVGDQYRHLDQLLVASYLCSLLYWMVSFAQKEAERREFSPQMQTMLLAVAGAARTTRVALATSTPGKGNPHRKP